MDISAVAGCSGIDIRKDGELWWSNSENTETFGTLASRDWGAADSLGSNDVEVRHISGSAIGLALDKNNAYYISNNFMITISRQTRSLNWQRTS